MAFPLWCMEGEEDRERGRKREGVGEREKEMMGCLVSLLVRTVISPDQGPTFIASFNLIIYWKSSLQVQSHWDLGLQHRNLGEDTNQSLGGLILLR